MDFEEIQKYKERIESEYLEMLKWRQGILKQIEIDEQEVSKIPDKDKRIIELMSESEKLKLDLKGIKSQLEAKREADSKDEVLIYTERLKKEYDDLLRLRQGILNQSKEDTEVLKQLNDQKEQVIAQIAQEIMSARKVVSDIYLAKSGIIRDLAAKEIKISEKERQLSERESQIAEELHIAKKTKEQYESGMNVIVAERKELAGEKDQIIFKKQMIEQVLGTEEKRLKDLTHLKTALTNKNKIQKQILKGIVVKELKVKQRNEAAMKKEEFLIQKQEEIDKDRKHLESQQQTLQRAFEIARQRGIK